MQEDPFDDGSKKIIEDANERRRRRELSDLKTLLGAVEGRRFIWRIFEETGIFRSCYDQNALAMSNKEGKRDIGLWILLEIKKVSFSTLSQMQREADSDKRSEEEDIKRKKDELEK